MNSVAEKSFIGFEVSIILLLLSLLQFSLTLPEEFCHYETFKAQCPPEHVILIRSAFYGRKNLGRCVRMNFGFVGCYSSVLYFLDDRCSGRESCKVEVIEPSFDNIRPCNDELKSYLEAEYTCIRVMQEQSKPCYLRLSWKPEQWTLPPLGSNPACGTELAPWTIHGPSEGLRIKTELIQFSAEAKHSSVEVPSISVMIRETATASKHAKIMTSHPVQSNSSVVLHPSTNARHQHLHTSLSSSIKVLLRLDQPRAADDFLFLFSVICPEVQLPQNMVAHYSNNRSVVKVTCRNADQSWTLICADSGWHGSVGNCSHQTQRLAGRNPPLSGRHSRLRITTAIVAIIVVGVSVSISLCVLVFGLLVMKRIKGSKLFRRSSLLVDQSQARVNEPHNSGSFIALMPRSAGNGEKGKEFCPLKAQMLATQHRHFHHQCPVIPLNLSTQLGPETLRDKIQPGDHSADLPHSTHLLDCLHPSTPDFFTISDSTHHKNANHLLKCIACSQDHKDPRVHPHEGFPTTPPDFLISSISESSHHP